MPLKERQVKRYARQVLLKEVGGRGQEALLSTGAAVLGTGAAQAVALAYAAAAGAPIRVPQNRAVEPSEVGFLLDAQDIGQPLGTLLEGALKDLNPDSVQKPAAAGLLGELPAQVSVPPPWVLIGWSGERGAVLYRTDDGCAACFMHSMLAVSRGAPS